MIKMIAALSKNNQIGIDGHMPWHIPADLEYFKQVTTGYPIIMGRKTFESIGRPLPNRRNIVLTRDMNYHHEGIEVLHTFKEVLDFCKDQQVFIIGGGELYSACLPYADELYLTFVDLEIKGDTVFPYFKNQFTCIKSTCPENQDSSAPLLTFTTWIRK